MLSLENCPYVVIKSSETSCSICMDSISANFNGDTKKRQISAMQEKQVNWD